MSRRPVVIAPLSSLLALICLVYGPLWAQEPTPLGPPWGLPPAEETFGHTPPELVVCDDGAVFAVWAFVVTDQLLARRIGPAGPGEILELTAPGTVGSQVDVARSTVDGDERVLVVTNGPPEDEPSAGLVSWVFDCQGGRLSDPVAIDGGSHVGGDLVARPDGTFAVTSWRGWGQPEPVLQMRFLDRNGTQLESRIEVTRSLDDQFPAPAEMAADDGGEILVLWRTRAPSGSRAIHGRGFAPGGRPLGEPFVLTEENRADVGFDVAAIGEPGRFLAVWRSPRGISDSPVILRPIDGRGEALGDDQRIPSPDREVLVGLVGGADEGFVVWNQRTVLLELRTSAALVSARRIAPDGRPTGPRFQVAPPAEFVELDEFGEFPFLMPSRLEVVRREDRLAVGWGVENPTGVLPSIPNIFYDSGVRLFDVARLGPPPPSPPSRAGLTSPDLPGFRVWAEITPQGQATIAGTRGADCLPEVLCIAGALPGRAEVFVRVIGPRPNGYLWPVLVQLTPSEVEVWIEQIATGEIRYYRLDAAGPGVDELDGLFDRTGFLPH
jgi:hypothetical protein